MYIRCPRCLQATRLFPEYAAGEFTCTDCGVTHALGTLDALGRTVEARAGRALVFAAQRGIDLASAYSVLLGLLSIERALKTDQESLQESAGGDEAAERVEREGPRAARYDRGFLPAVEEGFLTSRQAVERGDRVLYASKLAREHGLSMHLAFLVADNRVPLREALSAATREKRGPEQRAAPSQDRSAAYAGALAVLAGSATILAIIGFLTVSSLSDQDVMFGNQVANATPGGPGLPAPRVETAVVVRSNADDEVVEVRGRDPRAVLEAFCRIRPGCRMRGLHPSPGGLWTGSYEEAGRPESIAIRTTADGAVWSATPAATAEPLAAYPPEPEPVVESGFAPVDLESGDPG